MKFSLTVVEQGFAIAPLSGKLQGQCIAHAESLRLENVKLINQEVITGTIVGSHGLTLLNDNIDAATTKGLAIGQGFWGGVYRSKSRPLATLAAAQGRELDRIELHPDGVRYLVGAFARKDA